MIAETPELHPCSGACQAHCPSPNIVTGQLVINPGVRLAYIDDMPLALSPTEWRLLYALAQHLGQVLSTRSITHAVWGPHWGDDPHVIRVNIARVRAKLGPARHLIETHPGVGFRLLHLPAGVPAPAPAPRLRAVKPPKPPRPLAEATPRQHELLGILQAAAGERVSIQALCCQMYRREDRLARLAFDRMATALENRGYPVRFERGPAPVWGWVTLESTP